jgi:hypothetical protein
MVSWITSGEWRAEFARDWANGATPQSATSRKLFASIILKDISRKRTYYVPATSLLLVLWYFPNILYFSKERYSKCPTETEAVVLFFVLLLEPRTNN